MSCNHIIRHPQTNEERDAVRANLDNARRTGDDNAVLVILAQLQGCPTD